MYDNARVKINIEQWCVQSYYTLCQYAPDDSGRLLFAECDPDTGKGKIYIADSNGNIIDSFGENGSSSSFFHTGYRQTWSPDAKNVYIRAAPTQILLL